METPYEQNNLAIINSHILPISFGAKVLQNMVCLLKCVTLHEKYKNF